MTTTINVSVNTDIFKWGTLFILGGTAVCYTAYKVFSHINFLNEAIKEKDRQIILINQENKDIKNLWEESSEKLIVLAQGVNRLQKINEESQKTIQRGTTKINFLNLQLKLRNKELSELQNFLKTRINVSTSKASGSNLPIAKPLSGIPIKKIKTESVSSSPLLLQYNGLGKFFDKIGNS